MHMTNRPVRIHLWLREEPQQMYSDRNSEIISQQEANFTFDTAQFMLVAEHVRADHHKRARLILQPIDVHPLVTDQKANQLLGDLKFVQRQQISVLVVLQWTWSVLFRGRPFARILKKLIFIISALITIRHACVAAGMHPLAFDFLFEFILRT